MAPLLFQSQSTTPDAGQQQTATVPVVAFDLNWEAATPQNYTITMDANGNAQYVSRSPTRTPEGSDEPDRDYTIAFTMSTANRRRPLQPPKDLNYFNGNFHFT